MIYLNDEWCVSDGLSISLVNMYLKIVGILCIFVLRILNLWFLGVFKLLRLLNLKKKNDNCVLKYIKGWY